MSNLISKLAIGSVQFGLDYGINNTSGKVPYDEVIHILDFAYENHIRTIDTARSYGDSESILGNCNMGKWKVVSKFTPENYQQSIKEQLQLSLKNLQLEKLYAYLAHSADCLIDNPDYWLQLKELKASGFIERIGYSLYTVEQLERLIALDYIPDLIQVQYNLIDRRFEPYFEFLKKNKCEIHVRSAFLQGLFFKENIPDYFSPLKPILQLIQSGFPDKHKRAAYLLSFCLINPKVDKVVIGIQSFNELKLNLHALSSNDFNNLDYPDVPEVNSELLLPYNWPKTA